jgi:hypothetical protein
MFNGVSTSGTSLVIVQIGSTTFTTTGYSGGATYTNTASGASSVSNGICIGANSSAAHVRNAILTLCALGSNVWVGTGITAIPGETGTGGGAVALSGTLDRVRITTVNGTDTFDAGSINILYE